MIYTPGMWDWLLVDIGGLTDGTKNIPREKGRSIGQEDTELSWSRGSPPRDSVMLTVQVMLCCFHHLQVCWRWHLSVNKGEVMWWWWGCNAMQLLIFENFWVSKIEFDRRIFSGYIFIPLTIYHARTQHADARLLWSIKWWTKNNLYCHLQTNKSFPSRYPLGWVDQHLFLVVEKL